MDDGSVRRDPDVLLDLGGQVYRQDLFVADLDFQPRDVSPGKAVPVLLQNASAADGEMARRHARLLERVGRVESITTLGDADGDGVCDVEETCPDVSQFCLDDGFDKKTGLSKWIVARHGHVGHSGPSACGA